MKRIRKTIITILTVLLLFTSVVNVNIFARQEEFYPRYAGSSNSIVDILKSYGVDSSFSSRQELASINNIQQYRGTSAQNNLLVSKAKSGLLVKSVYEVDDSPSTQTSNTSQQTSSNQSYFQKYTGTSGSLVDALRAVGADSSFSYRQLIASANGFGSYSGTSTENISLLNKLKNGVLVKPGGSQSKPVSQSTTNTNKEEKNSTTSSPQDNEEKKVSFQCDNYTKCTQDGNEIYEVVKNNTKVRQECVEEGKVYESLPSNTFISVAGHLINHRNNKWMVVEYRGEDGETRTGFVYSKNIKKHVHKYEKIYDNKEGSLMACMQCSYCVLKSNGKTFKANLESTLKQAALGDYSNETTTFMGCLARIAVSEIPGISTVSDFRDLCYDLGHVDYSKASSVVVLAADVVAFLPLVSVVKNSKYLWKARYIKKAVDASDLLVKTKKVKITRGAFDKFIGLTGKINKNSVSGTHNMDRFLEVLEQQDYASNLVITTKKHPTLPGILNVNYKTKSTKKLSNMPKTLYDPDVYSDSDILYYAIQAFENGDYDKKSNIIKGFSSNGLCFIGNLNEKGYINHFFIALDTK